MCKVCVSTGRMTSAELDQIEAAERDGNIIALTATVEQIEARVALRLTEETVELDPPDPETDALNNSLDELIATLVGMAGEYDGLSLKQAHLRLASDLREAGTRQLAYGLAAIIVRIRRNSQ